MTYLDRQCRQCGRHYHEYQFWHMGDPRLPVCDLCWSEMYPRTRASIRPLLPNPMELSAEPVTNASDRDYASSPVFGDGDALRTLARTRVVNPDDISTLERFRMLDPVTAEITLPDGTTVRHRIP